MECLDKDMSPYDVIGLVDYLEPLSNEPALLVGFCCKSFYRASKLLIPTGLFIAGIAFVLMTKKIG